MTRDVRCIALEMTIFLKNKTKQTQKSRPGCVGDKASLLPQVGMRFWDFTVSGWEFQWSFV